MREEGGVWRGGLSAEQGGGMAEGGGELVGRGKEWHIYHVVEGNHCFCFSIVTSFIPLESR